MSAGRGSKDFHGVHLSPGADHQLAGGGEAVRQQSRRCRGLGEPGSHLLPEAAAGHRVLPCATLAEPQANASAMQVPAVHRSQHNVQFMPAPCKFSKILRLGAAWMSVCLSVAVTVAGAFAADELPRVLLLVHGGEQGVCAVLEQSVSSRSRKVPTGRCQTRCIAQWYMIADLHKTCAGYHHDLAC